jgi:hypothetical protein
MIFMFNKLPSGKMMGTSDGAHPVSFSPRDLSATHDALYEIECIFGEKMAKTVWEALPQEFRMDYNWSKWKYMPKGK